MREKARSVTLKVIGGFTIAAGLFVGFWFCTVGLLITLFSYDTNKDASAFLLLIIGVIFSLLLLIGGIGIIRRRPWARLLLIVSYALALIPIIGYMAGEIWYGFSSDGLGSEFFDAWSWLGGIIFWSFMTVLLISIIRFLKSGRTRELLEEHQNA